VSHLRPVTIVCPVYGGVPKAAPSPGPSSRFEAAGSGPTNRRHWANADDLGPLCYASAETRRVLRRRARYERDNDPHLDGLAKTLANDLIGTGPRLQLGLGEQHYAAARMVEQSFAAWCRAIDLAEDLRVGHEGKTFDGETFGQFVTNPMLPSPVKLDLRVMEPELVQTPDVSINPRAVDGIEFDSAGNPAWYHVLREHPGDGWAWGMEYDRVPARLIVHWFRPRRAGQARGISELASALEIGAQTRRYSAAVLSAAEFAAMLAGVLEQETAPGEDAVTDLTSWNEIEMTRGALLTLPKGTKASQFKPEQPTNSYKEFVAEKRNEMARPTLAPFNVISGNSSGYNYSSGRLDHVPYHRFVWIERERLRHRVLDRLFLAWYAEAQLIGLIPDSLPAVNEWQWEWQWDGFASIDPLKDTQASQLRLAIGLTTQSEEQAAEGKNWRDSLRQRFVERKEEMDLEAEFGFSLIPVDPAKATDSAEEPADA
jgi:lambda family phage portal protein